MHNLSGRRQENYSLFTLIIFPPQKKAMESIEKFILYIFSEWQSFSSRRNGLNLCTGDFADKTKRLEFFLVAIVMARNSLCLTFSSAVSSEFCLVAISSSPLLDIPKKHFTYPAEKIKLDFWARKTEIGCCKNFKWHRRRESC